MARKITPLQEEEIKKLLKLHWSDAEIAGKTGVNRDTVKSRRFQFCGGVLGMQSRPRKLRKPLKVRLKNISREVV